MPLETGARLGPYEITATIGAGGMGEVYRARWMPDGRALAFVGLDERGLPGIYVQDFEPGRDTIASRRPLAGFHQNRFTESFGISRDGGRMILGVVREIQNIMLAEGVAGVR